MSVIIKNPEATRQTVATLIELKPARKHERNSVNIKNNQGFALLDGQIVEVVRRGKSLTRIRLELDRNAPTQLVETDKLEGYYHPKM